VWVRILDKFKVFLGQIVAVINHSDMHFYRNRYELPRLR
jgi:hypothetical protein